MKIQRASERSLHEIISWSVFIFIGRSCHDLVRIHDHAAGKKFHLDLLKLRYGPLQRILKLRHIRLPAADKFSEPHSLSIIIAQCKKTPVFLKRRCIK